MHISQIEIFHIEIPLKRPFETSFGRITDRPALIVKMTANDGTTGFGEASPLSVPISEPETVQTGLAFLSAHAPALLAADVDAGYDITQRYPSDTHPVSRIGLEGAYLDLAAHASHMPFAQLFGQAAERVPLAESASLHDSIEETFDEIRSFIDAGAKRIKVKIAPGRDVDRIGRIRAEFGALAFGVDANAAYGPDDVDHLARMAEFGISFIEQPFAASDIASHAELRRRGLVVCLDESIGSAEDCETAIAQQACDMVNVKPARIGSFREAKRVHDLCTAAGIRLFGGGRLETGIGKTANAAFYSLPGFTDASDITPPSEYLAEDIIEPPFAAIRGEYEVPRARGLGITVSEDTLKKYLKSHIVFGR